PFAVEGDWSAASYWYEILALSRDAQAKVFLKGLQAESSQGDSRGAVLFEKLGVKTSFVEGGAWISKCGEPVREIVEDLVDIPDLAQTFVVTCCMMGIPFRFTGLQSLKIKETDRIVALQQELHKLGFVVSSENDSILYWQGERCTIEDDAVIQTYEDHRMAMAFAPACLRLPSIKIAHPKVVTKSYPEFWSHLVEAKFEIK
ncbi:MAG: 3-phosphoshikimate 1-carboxyvinyltransferase, partial [Bacteroidales bacterium]|nr:3-phosphoshikimate 1-carboxyvinyltransferase [Bacteroidales bacterium]